MPNLSENFQLILNFYQKRLWAADALGYIPRPICTNPVMMMRARANILAYVKTSWTRVAHFTLAQFTKVSTTTIHTKQSLETTNTGICKSISIIKILTCHSSRKETCGNLIKCVTWLANIKRDRLLTLKTIVYIHEVY